MPCVMKDQDPVKLSDWCFIYPSSSVVDQKPQFNSIKDVVLYGIVNDGKVEAEQLIEYLEERSFEDEKVKKVISSSDFIQDVVSGMSSQVSEIVTSNLLPEIKVLSQQVATQQETTSIQLQELLERQKEMEARMIEMTAQIANSKCIELAEESTEETIPSLVRKGGTLKYSKKEKKMAIPTRTTFSQSITEVITTSGDKYQFNSNKASTSSGVSSGSYQSDVVSKVSIGKDKREANVGECFNNGNAMNDFYVALERFNRKPNKITYLCTDKIHLMHYTCNRYFEKKHTGSLGCVQFY